MALARASQVEAIRFMWIIIKEVRLVGGQQLVAMRKKLAKHVKEVRQKTKRGKESTFHSLSPSITSTLTFQTCITLSPVTKSKTKYKEEEEELT